MNFFRKTALLFILIISVTSLQAQKLEQYIPKDATLIMSMDLGNLNSKISFDKLKQYDFYQEMMKEMERELSNEDEKLQEMMKSPEEFGIDIMKKSYLFLNTDDKGEPITGGFVFNISDNKKFTKLVKETVVPESKGGVMGQMGKFQTFTDKEGVLAWKKNIGLLIMGDNKSVNEGTARENNVTAFAKTVLNSTPAKSILSDARYLKATKGKKSDMRMWMDYEWVLDLQMQGNELSAMGMGGMVEVMKEMYKDTDYMVDLNFNDGAMVMDANLFSNNKTLDRMRKMMTGELNKDFFKYLPKQSMMGYFSMAMDTENFADGMFEMFDPMIKEMGMSRSQMEDMALQTLTGMGLELDRKGLYELIKGDMVFAVTGMREFTIKKTQYDEDFNQVEVEAKQMLPEFTAMMSYGKETEVMKLVNMAVGFGVLTKEGDAFKLAIPNNDIPMDMFLSMKDGVMFITNNTEIAVGKYANGLSKGDRITKDQQKMMNNHSGIFFWDIPQTLNAAAAYAQSEGMTDKMTDKMINVSKQSLESLVMKTDKKIKDSSHSEFSLNFVNKRMNSLDQLFSYFNEMYLTAMSSGGM